MVLPTQQNAAFVIFLAMLQETFALEGFPSTSEVSEPMTPLEVAVRLVAATLLVACSALSAGLTLGVLGLDTLSLEVIADSGPEPDRTHAKKIMPIRKRGNQLLCTLLIGNVMTNVLISILTERLTNGLLGFVISTVVIVIFGEIVPQAVCSRHALKIGAASVPAVYFLMFLFYIFAKPISIILDIVLGDESGQIYDRNMLRKLIALHAMEHSQTSGLKPDDFTLMAGAIDFEEKRVHDLVTPIEEVFMLEKSTVLTESVITEIWENGHSRIPVYDSSRTNVVGILFVKDLLFVDPEDGISIETVLKLSSKGREVHFTFEDSRLKDLLKMFASGRAHLAIVRRVEISVKEVDPIYTVTGIITLEDVIEELIRVDIQDEIDAEGDRHKHTSIANFRWKTKARRLTESQVRAVSKFLYESIEEVQHLGDKEIRALVMNAEVLDLEPGFTLYKYDAVITHFTLLIHGKIEIKVGREGLKAELPPWTTLGAHTLKTGACVRAEYEAVTAAPSRILSISRSQFEKIEAVSRSFTVESSKLTLKSNVSIHGTFDSANIHIPFDEESDEKTLLK